MPKEITKPRKRRAGGGRKPKLERPTRLVTYLEAEEAQALSLLDAQGNVAETMRTALREYLAREDVQMRVHAARELAAVEDAHV